MRTSREETAKAAGQQLLQAGFYLVQGSLSYRQLVLGERDPRGRFLPRLVMHRPAVWQHPKGLTAHCWAETVSIGRPEYVFGKGARLKGGVTVEAKDEAAVSQLIERQLAVEAA